MRYHQQRRAPREARGLARAVRDIGGLAICVHRRLRNRQLRLVQRPGPHIEPPGRQNQRARPHLGEPHLRYRDHSLRPKLLSTLVQL